MKEFLIGLKILPSNRKIKKLAPEANGFFEVLNEVDTFLKLELLQLIFTVIEDSNTALQGNDKLRNLFKNT